ncbi:YkgJ family cysteine cluster protein [Niveibacterium sp. 24ML]|uniref:YkgJ family cysteine cluster protein n=1 Tax=Niveibacterium sp. 24ML TaxID=2985512 RepID=UPI0022711F2B|nr:YkgJ family cysteine cluster protein [Niveibacterium sp. 24ML]MCX9156751.1 YkgJ family cysteine cluster protein [Niveibacterium sp. 24ML]
MSSHTTSLNPCLSCGACCAHFRVSFYWSEATAKGLPENLTEQINTFFACMAGTNDPHAPRCIALSGQIGVAVACQHYEMRPEACKDVEAGDEKCARARARHGLPPLPTAQDHAATAQ